ncbi:MAG: hypothetical protein AAF798_13635 [Bacteroidota bacterium]
MKKILSLAFFICLFSIVGYAQDKPSYCDDIPDEYSKGVIKKKGALPKFTTKAVKLYKVQVAILRNTNPESYPFHSSLVARYRPCEQVWVVESKKTFKTRSEADKEKANLRKLGYGGCYVTTILGYQ